VQKAYLAWIYDPTASDQPSQHHPRGLDLVQILEDEDLHLLRGRHQAKPGFLEVGQTLGFAKESKSRARFQQRAEALLDRTVYLPSVCRRFDRRPYGVDVDLGLA
jgi:hypothetical protein